MSNEERISRLELRIDRLEDGREALVKEVHAVTSVNKFMRTIMVTLAFAIIAGISAMLLK